MAKSVRKWWWLKISDFLLNPLNTRDFEVFGLFSGLVGSMVESHADPRSGFRGRVRSRVKGQGQGSKVKVKVKGHWPTSYILICRPKLQSDQKMSPGFRLNFGRQAGVQSCSGLGTKRDRGAKIFRHFLLFDSLSNAPIPSSLSFQIKKLLAK